MDGPYYGIIATYPQQALPQANGTGIRPSASDDNNNLWYIVYHLQLSMAEFKYDHQTYRSCTYRVRKVGDLHWMILSIET